ncbi:MAG: hypothetical protein HY363_01390 [Candidatus Aenigmarchaeota archaeon]|nr:hypothetical protein [Candidatus Aenigmarchaeota archaeon]
MNKLNQQNVILSYQELSDLYAMKTFYEYLKISDIKARITFSGYTAVRDRENEILSDCNGMKWGEGSIDVIVRTFSDTSQSYGAGYVKLGIDAALLKNCVVPMDEKQKQELREKYVKQNIQGKRIITIGFSPMPVQDKLTLSGRTYHELTQIVDTLCTSCFFYFVGDTPQDQIPQKYKEHICCVNEQGVLKDFYALADITINARNIERTDKRLNNFVEATEGGPLFMVPSTNTKQYGYKQLVTAEAIKECSDANDIIDKIQQYIIADNENKEVSNEISKKRAGHLLATRAKYLPIFESYLRELLQIASLKNRTDLKVQSPQIVITHPESDWIGYAELR